MSVSFELLGKNPQTVQTTKVVKYLCGCTVELGCYAASASRVCTRHDEAVVSVTTTTIETYHRGLT
jgi:hypothetical protein